MMRLQAKDIWHIGRIWRIGEVVDDAVTYLSGPCIDRPVAMINVDRETETWYYYH